MSRRTFGFGDEDITVVQTLLSLSIVPRGKEFVPTLLSPNDCFLTLYCRLKSTTRNKRSTDVRENNGFNVSSRHLFTDRRTRCLDDALEKRLTRRM